MVTMGLGLMTWVFTRSLQPNTASDAALPRIATSGIAPETFVYSEAIATRLAGESADMLLVRLGDGRLMAWYVPVRDGLHHLPDMHWWRPGRPCRDLRPDFQARQIACADKNLPDEIARQFRWTLEGKALNPSIPDMAPMPGVEESGFFVLYKRH